MVGAIIVKLDAYVPEFAEEEDHGDCAGEAKDGTEGGPEDAEEPKGGFKSGVNHGILQFGIMCIRCSYGLRLFTVEGFFKDALNEVLQTKAVLNGVDFEAAVKIGAYF